MTHRTCVWSDLPQSSVLVSQILFSNCGLWQHGRQSRCRRCFELHFTYILFSYSPAVLGERWNDDVNIDRSLTHMSLPVDIKQNSLLLISRIWLMICICLISSIKAPSAAAQPHSLQFHTPQLSEVINGDSVEVTRVLLAYLPIKYGAFWDHHNHVVESWMSLNSPCPFSWHVLTSYRCLDAIFSETRFSSVFLQRRILYLFVFSKYQKQKWQYL